MSVKDQWIAFIHQLQDEICQALEHADGQALFREDQWQRPEGGGGKTRVMEQGAIFEKGGVNSSVVFGTVTDLMRKQLNIDGDEWFACGLSLVIHPENPFIPTVHANFRMFELYQDGAVLDRWFGGGADLTPYYLDPQDIIHFHQTWKSVCDQYGEALYPQFKKQCDDYFVNWHRNAERRGVGGIFYDHLNYIEHDLQEIDWLLFSQSCGREFLNAYLPILQRHRGRSFTARHKLWQQIRRGRYVEFNLIHDRGTLFGLKTNGRIESILMSLPPTVRFNYDFQPTTEENELLQICLQPKDWV